jgi:hypothetical protein
VLAAFGPPKEIALEKENCILACQTMANPTISKIQKKTGKADLLSTLTELPLSELNSLLMEIFRLKASEKSPAELAAAYRNNRFVAPSTVPPVEFLESELELLKLAEQFGFTCLELSPLAPLGSCSSIAPVNQNKIVSALRGTEIVADATNMIALEIAARRTACGFDRKSIHLCATHRHVRAQALPGKGFYAHFKIFCAVTGMKDTGNFQAESDALVKHLELYHHYLNRTLGLQKASFIFKSLDKDGEENRLATACWKSVSGMAGITRTSVSQSEHAYYKGVRFTINIELNGNEYNIGDGGFVDWAEKLSGNKKERLITSAIGTERLFKVLRGLD